MQSKAYEGLSYTGVAYKIGENGEYEMISVSQCEFGCASGGLCGDETTCKTAAIIGWIFLGIFGCCFCSCLVIFLVGFCKAANGLKQASDSAYRRM